LIRPAGRNSARIFRISSLSASGAPCGLLISRHVVTDDGAKEQQMNNAYQFLAKLPSNGSVASLVTLLVSAWFLVAAGAILTDPTSVYTQRAVVTAQAGQPQRVVAQAATPATPEAHTTIMVIAARRNSGLRQVSATSL
jgi:hypothetical protein